MMMKQIANKYKLCTDTIVSLFAKQVRENNNNRCLCFSERIYTFLEVDNMANHIAFELIKSGAQKGDVIGIYVDQSELIFILPLAIMKAGCAYLPLDYTLPTGRIDVICNDANAKIVLVENKCRLKSDTFSCIEISISKLQIYKDVVTNYCFPVISPKDSMVVLYTSGSTGEPKGVIHNHHTCVCCNIYDCERFELDKTDNILLYVNYSFVLGMHMYQSVVVGACLFIATNELKNDLIELNRYMERNNISVTSMSTQVGYLFCKTVRNTSLKFMSVAGGVMQKLSYKPNFKLINCYGNTESMSTFYYDISDPNTPVSLGFPNEYATFRIVDEEEKDVVIGEEGELWLTGESLASGYINDNDLTNQKFVYRNGVRYYKTGDIVKYLSERNIKYVGRKDDMIKLRGVRIELLEIEKQLLLVPEISEAIVCTKTINQIQHICAYFTSNEDIDINCIRTKMEENLSSYMLPSFFIRMEKLPLNNHGKIDKSLLPIPTIENNNTELGMSYKEEIVLDCVNKVLNTQMNISINDNFYDIGGDSIAYLQLIGELREKGFVLETNSLKKYKLISEIVSNLRLDCECISHNYNNSDIFNNPAVSFILNNNSQDVINGFVVPIMFVVYNRLEYKSISKILDYIVTRHDMLRALIVNNKFYVRSLSEPNLYRLEECDIETDDVDTIRQTINNYRSTFDVFSKSMIQVLIIHSPINNYLLLDCNHMVSDQVSKNIITEDFCTLYEQVSQNAPLQLKKSSDSYLDYSKSLKSLYDTDYFYTEKEYWRTINNYLAQQAEIDFIEADVYENQYIKLASNYTASISSKGENSITVSVLTAFSRSWRKLNNCDSIAFQLLNHGREPIINYYNKRPILLDRTIGFFPINYPIVLNLSEDNLEMDLSNTKQSLFSVPNNGLGFYAHGGYSSNHLPMFCFDYLGNYAKKEHNKTFNRFMSQVSSKYLGDYIKPNLHMGAPFTIFAIIKNSELVFNVRYNTRLFSKDLCKTILDSMINQLEIISNSDF